MSAVVEFSAVSKRFTLSEEQPHSLQESLLRMLRLRRSHAASGTFWALRELSFAVERGTTVGLIGTNGSGKSTALKLMAGILQPTAGAVRVAGRISALLELGSGMHPDLTGRDNIFLNGTMLGLSNAQIRRLFPAIVDFSELGRFIDVPVKHYSSGMYMRLGFSVAIHSEPELLILDEVLSVGDQAFQAKCLDRIYAMKKRGVTIAMVSHSIGVIEEMCSHAVWLKDGSLMAQGRTTEVGRAYLRDLHESSAHGSGTFTTDTVPPGQRWGSGEVEINAVRLRGSAGEATDRFRTGESLTVELDYLAKEPIEDPMFGLAIHHMDGTHINGPNNKFSGHDIPRIEGRGTVCYTIPALPLMPGSYEISVSAYDGNGAHGYDTHWRAYPFHVDAGETRERYGMFLIPAHWSHEPPAA